MSAWWRAFKPTDQALTASDPVGDGDMDWLAGIIGALVIASWSYGLIYVTGAILLDTNQEPKLGEKTRQTIEGDGDKVAELRL